MPNLKTKSFTLLRCTDVLLNFPFHVFSVLCDLFFCLFLFTFDTRKFRFPGFGSIIIFFYAYLHTIQKLLNYLSSICSRSSMWFLDILDKELQPSFSSKFDLGCVLYIKPINVEKRLFNSFPFLANGLT